MTREENLEIRDSIYSAIGLLEANMPNYVIKVNLAELRNSLNILKRDREATGYKEPDNG